MDQSECKSLNQLIFDLGSRLGSLEGYLYSEEKVEKNYLPEWLNNINREFDSLPAEARIDIARDYLEVLKKVQALLHKLYGAEDDNSVRVKRMVARLEEESP